MVIAVIVIVRYHGTGTMVWYQLVRVRYQVVIVVIGILQQFSLYYYYRMRLNF